MAKRLGVKSNRLYISSYIEERRLLAVLVVTTKWFWVMFFMILSSNSLLTQVGDES